MREQVMRYRWVIEPAVAILLLVAWASASAAGMPHGRASSQWLMLLLACGALAASRRFPALAVGVAIPAVLAGVVLVGPDGDAVAYVLGYLALLCSVAGIATGGGARLQWWALAIALSLGPATLLIGWAAEGAGAVSGIEGSMTVIARHAAVVNTALLTAVVPTAVWFAGRRTGPADAGGREPGRGAGTALAGHGRLRRWTDILVAAVFLLAALAFQGASPIAWAATIVFAVALTMRRSAPRTALALVWVGALVQVLVGSPVAAFDDIAVLMVLYACASYGDATARWTSLASVPVGAVTATAFLIVGNGLTDLPGSGALSQPTPSESATRVVALFAAVLVVLLLFWVLGLLARMGRRARHSRVAQVRAEAEQQRAEERIVVEQERNRIARDMHDVVAHSLAVVIAQADGARYLGRSDPDQLDGALVTISQTARQALGDVRLLLAQLRHSESAGPQPGLDDLDALLDRMRGAGLHVDVTAEGERPELGTATQIALYRIVQEALTNALRHGAAGRPVRLRYAYDETGVRITIANELRGVDGAASGGGRRYAQAAGSAEGAAPDGARRSGHGLPGMVERATLAGGWARTTEGDSMFTVIAFLPASGGRPGRPA